MANNTTTKTETSQLAAKNKKPARSAAAPAAKKNNTRKKTVRPAVVSAAVVWQETLFEALPNPYDAPVPPYLWIDHPQQGDILHGPDYVIRLGVGGAAAVELSIDRGDWQPCRLNSGYWWYDWSNIAAGTHTLVARMKTPDNVWYRTPERLCQRM